MKLLLATRNRNKVRELSCLLEDHGFSVELVSLADFPAVPEVAEDGATLEQNACKKALLPALSTRLWTLADDTGLEVAALEGRPGVLSARYAGEACDSAANNEKLLRELSGVALTARKAVFRCVVALSSPQGSVCIAQGRLEGKIALEPEGGNGFGYDPLFLVTELGKTLAQMTAREKSLISHRARAVGAIAPFLTNALEHAP